ncbi:helix-turn-helix domain-containing protein [Actinomadura latina]|uniref:PucR family transcriptional regulator n=1 Tax=Actinomadura latina TaxID=163603 RepID=A0A846Z5T3_9ACTN|nr:helix-turn-helix domain-containing protein [Actinomadura latina]NKZ07621.1 PucR family transcriptional regulator [Actinomadura latina]
MKGLLLRLSALDADAENAVRVISFFDGLIAAKVSPQTLVRETARLAECPAAIVDTALGLSLHATPAPPGRATADRPAADRAAGGVSGVSRAVSGTGRVWLGRDEPLPLDEIVLERFAIAARVLLEAVPRREDSGLVELALSADAGELERCRALRRLRVEPDERVYVLAVDGAGDVEMAGAHVVSIGRARAVLAKGLPERFPRGLRVGVGSGLPAIEAPASWRQALTALRFTGLGEDVVHYDGLGALAVIAARMRDEDIAAVADVAALDGLAAEPNGAGMLAVLAAFCATGSARRAAARVHRHHSTIAARLAQAEAWLGFSFSAPGGRRRLDLAVLLRHLRDNPAALNGSMPRPLLPD